MAAAPAHGEAPKKLGGVQPVNDHRRGQYCNFKTHLEEATTPTGIRGAAIGPERGRPTSPDPRPIVDARGLVDGSSVDTPSFRRPYGRARPGYSQFRAGLGGGAKVVHRQKRVSATEADYSRVNFSNSASPVGSDLVTSNSRRSCAELEPARTS